MNAGKHNVTVQVVMSPFQPVFHIPGLLFYCTSSSNAGQVNAGDRDLGSMDRPVEACPVQAASYPFHATVSRRHACCRSQPGDPHKQEIKVQPSRVWCARCLYVWLHGCVQMTAVVLICQSPTIVGQPFAPIRTASSAKALCCLIKAHNGQLRCFGCC